MYNAGNSIADTHYFLNLLKRGSWFLMPALLWFVAAPFVLVYFRDGAIYRFINSHYNALFDAVLPFVTILGTGYFTAAIVLFLLFFSKFRSRRYVLAASLCNIVPGVFAQIIKNIINAPRPLKYLNQASWIHYVEGQPLQYHLSFPSGHTVSAFALCCFLTLLLGKKYPYWGIAFFLVALAIGYSRIYLSQHFFSDVYAGSIIGTLGCLLMFWLVDRKGAIIGSLSKKDIVQ